MSPPDAGDRGTNSRVTGEGAALISEGLARLWPHEARQFAAAMERAQAGEPAVAALVGEAGRGKTWLLSALVDGARARGHTGLHVHLDRYFCPRGLAARMSARLVQLNPHLAGSLPAPVPTAPDDLPAALLGADAAAREGDRAVVLAFSGLDAHLDAPADDALLEFFTSLLDAAQAAWRRTLCLVELRSPVERAELQSVARRGLVYFPVGEPSPEVIESVLSAARAGGVPFAPTVTPVAATRARGNLHRLVAAMRSVSARAAAAGIREVGPVEWEALDARDFSADVNAAAADASAPLLAALVDWPAGGCIPLDDLAWRLRAEGAVTTAMEFRELVAALETDAPVLGLAHRADPSHLSFTWPELRTALTRAVLGGASERDVSLRRRLQAAIAVARRDAAHGDIAAALRRIEGVIPEAGGEGMDAFQRQSAALAEGAWLGEGPAHQATRAQAAQLLARAAGQAAAPMLARGLAANEVEAQQAAGDALAGIGPGAVPAVAHILDGDDHDARLRAIGLLGRVPCEEALDAVLRVLSEPDTDVRLTALGSVSALGRDRAGPAVAELVSDSDPTVRAAAIRCLAALKYAPAIAVVCEALVDESEDTRSAATEALTELGDEQAIPALLERMTDAGGRVRTAAARALAIFGERARRALLETLQSAEADMRAAAARGFMFFPPRQAVPAVVPCLRDHEPVVVEAATEALAAFGADAVEPVASLLGDREPHAQRNAAHVLALIGPPAVRALQQRLGSRVAPTRAAAALALGEMRHEPAVPDLGALARDPDSSVRRAAVRALCMVATPAALEPVVEAMSDADAGVAAEAARSVAGFGPAALPALISRLDTPDPALRSAVVETLAGMPDVAVPALIAALGDARDAVRAAAIEALTRLNAAEAAEPVLDLLAAPPPVGAAARGFALGLPDPCMIGLIERLGADDEELRTATREVCAAIGAPATPALISVFKAGSGQARLEALAALVTIRDERALEHIIAACADASSVVRARVASALGRFEAPEGLRPLCTLAADSAPVVRSAAVDALRSFGAAAVAELLDYYDTGEGAVAPELTEALLGLGESAAEALADLCGAPLPQRRAAAVRCLAGVGPERLLNRLPALLGDDDALVRGAVHDATGALGESALPALMAALGEDDDEAAAFLAAECLLTVGRPALAALVALLADAENPRRARAIPVLTGLRLPEALGPLADALGDVDEVVRTRAREAVAQFGAQAVPPLLERLDHRDPVMQEAVTATLADVDEPARPALFDILATGAGVRQLLALRVLAQVGAVEAAPVVAGLLTGRPPLAEAAREFLLQHIPHAVPSLGNRLEDPDPRLREAVAQLLVEIGDPAVEELGRVAVEGSAEARLAAAQALGQAPGERAVIALTLVLGDSDARLRAVAAAALVGRGALREAVPAVEDLDGAVRRAVLEALRPHGKAAVNAILERFAGTWEELPAHGVAALRSLGRGATAALLDTLRKPGAPGRADAVRLLCALEYAAALPEVAAALGDTDEQVRVAAHDGLVGAGATAAPALIEAMATGPAAAREGAAQCLVELGSPVAKHVLAAAADPARPGRAAAIRVLVHINPPGLPEHLVEWLEDDAEAVRVAAAHGLGRLRPDHALPALFDGIDADTEAAREARLEAVCAYGPAAVPMLLARMSDPAYGASPALARALAALGDLVADTLVAWLDDPETQHRLAAARALQHVHVEAAVPGLVGRVIDEQAEVRQAAALALAGMGPAAGGQLVARLAEPNPARRELYAEALAVQPDEILAAVAARLEDPDPAIRAAALDVLRRAPRETFAEAVARRLDDKEAPVRAAACLAVAAQPGPDTVEALLTALDDTDAQVADAAEAGLRMLGRLAHEALVPRLITAEGTLDERVLRGLAATGAAGPVLKECLAHESARVRAGAAAALPAVLGPAATSDLVGLLADPQEMVRSAVVTALAGLGEEAAHAALGVLAAGAAPACLAAADVIAQTGGQLTDDLLKLLRADRAGARAGAARALGRLGHAEAAAHLVTRLKDPDADVRFESVTALGLLKWANATPHLLSTLEDADEHVAGAAITALTRIGEPAIEVLITRLVTAQGQVRDDVVYALAGIGEASVPALMRAMEVGAEATHLAVLRALGIIGGEVAVMPLVDALADGSPALQAEAARGVQALGRIAVAELVSRLSAMPAADAARRLADALVELREAALPEVAALLDERDERLRETAADILARMGAPAAPALRKAAAHRNPHVRALALEGIARIGDLSMAPDVIEMLQDHDTGVVSQAIRALAVLGDPRGVAPVVRCVGSPSPAVREALAFAVQEFGAAAAPHLVHLLISDDPQVSEQATTLLRSLGKQAEAALLRQLDSDLPRARIAAVEVMGTLGSGAVIDPLAERLGEPDLDVRRAVAEALATIGAPAVGAVLKRLPDPDEGVSDGILMTLNAMSVDPVYSLMEQARHADETVRLAAVKMAGRYGRDEAVPTLRQRLQDTSTEINCAAATALGQIGTESAVQVLAEHAITDREALAEMINEALCEHAPVAVPMLVRLASRIQGGPDARYVGAAVGPARAAPGVVDQLLAHDEEPVREAAAAVLGEMGSDQSLRVLVRKARDPDAPVRRAAIAALGRMGTEALRPLAGLLDDRDPEARKAAADVLATLGPQAVDVLVRRLRASRDIPLCIVICHALARAHVTSAGDALVAVLEGGRDEGLRLAAASALAQLSRPEGLQALQIALGGADQAMRVEAAEALAALGGAAALALLPLVDDDNPRVRAAATGAFRHAGADEVDLLAQYAGHTDPGVRVAVATALREAPRNAEALRALVALLQDDDETVCAAALESLTVFGDVAIEHLGRQVLSPDADVRYAACWALGRLGAPAVDALLAALPEALPDSAGDILRALGRIGDPRTRAAVVQGMTDANVRVRVAAVGAMRRLATDEDARLLAAALADDDGNVRMVASSVIAGVMTDVLREAVVELLGHPFSEARAGAARILGQECHPTALQPLRNALRRETEPWVAEVMEGAAQAVEAA